jgi:hypothetical protein
MSSNGATVLPWTMTSWQSDLVFPLLEWQGVDQCQGDPAGAGATKLSEIFVLIPFLINKKTGQPDLNSRLKYCT